MKRMYLFYSLILLVLVLASCCNNHYDLSDYGIKPDVEANASPLFAQAIKEIKEKAEGKETIYITVPAGRYDFYPEDATEREYYISNHDQTNAKHIGIVLEDVQNIILDGQGAEFVFHGRMLPVSLTGSSGCTLKNFSIDFADPQITQVEIVENDTVAGHVTFRVAPWVEYEIRDSAFIAKGHEWEQLPLSGIAFEEATKRVVYHTGDIEVGVKNVTEVTERTIKSFRWKDKRLVPGTVVALRSWYRPSPGIFIDSSNDIALENIRVHYAEGMGLLAQMSWNIRLDGFSVCLRGDDDPRYFTTQADATHFSGCRGIIISRNGLYEGMMDDAINVHGTYLKVGRRVDSHTVEADYMHLQAYGFDWGFPGDSVQVTEAEKMEIVGNTYVIASIAPVDKPEVKGAKRFRITFDQPLEATINEEGTYGLENLSWTPEVVFSDNIIRNNRARGALFSTPRRVVAENNLFDHTSGTAILLCGDCNGWYESGPCKDVLIRGNTFHNALTSMYQFTDGVISISPVIPALDKQKRYYHSGIVIENNIFNTFDIPLVYAKSVDGLVFRNNTIERNTDYPAFHWNNHRFLLERVANLTIEQNTFDTEFDALRDVVATEGSTKQIP